MPVEEPSTHMPNREADLRSGGPPDTATYIYPSRGWVRIPWRELWGFRELLFFLTWRDIQVRYKQTAIGVAWAVLQPMLTMMVFAIFFGRFGGIPSDGMPYAVFALAALVPWSFFANSLTQTANSVVDNSQLITKIYFPRLLVPIASVLSRIVDFGLTFVLLIGVVMAFGIAPTPRMLLLPAFVLLAVTIALGVGFWLSAINVQFRDVQHVVPFLSQLWLFCTPVAYPSSILPQTWRSLYGINPMVGVVEGFRWSLLGAETKPIAMILVSTVVAIALLVSGIHYFHHVERRFADIV